MRTGTLPKRNKGISSLPDPANAMSIFAGVEDEPLRIWLASRRNNCLRIAESKTGADRVGWLDDAKYFTAALARLT